MGLSYEAEIEQYLDEHWDCLRKTEERPRGLRNRAGILQHYANDLEKFERDRRAHLKDHKENSKPPETISIADEFRETAREKYPTLNVDLEIDRALNRPRGRKMINVELYLDNWLRKAVEIQERRQRPRRPGEPSSDDEI